MTAAGRSKKIEAIVRGVLNAAFTGLLEFENIKKANKRLREHMVKSIRLSTE